MSRAVGDGNSSMQENLLPSRCSHDVENAFQPLVFLSVSTHSMSTPTAHDSRSRSSYIDRVFTEQFEFRTPYENYSRIETVIFTSFILLAAAILGSFKALQDYVPIETYCLSLLAPYLVIQYVVLRQMAHQMMKITPYMVINKKYLAFVLIVMVVALISSMIVSKYSFPVAASIPLAFLWRVSLSVCGVLIFCRIDSFFTNYHAFIRTVVNMGELHGPEETSDQNEYCSLASHKGALLQANKYLYLGFGLCALVNVIFYFLLYYFDKFVCLKISVVMYCSLIYVLCSTYFLLRMCELTKAVSGWEAAERAGIKVKVKILHWEPSGDLMVAYALGLLFVVFANFIDALHDEC